jgi:hypothetical protein
MRDIEGIETVMRKLEPHWPQMMAHFNSENEKFKALVSQDHDFLGRVLKCHRVVEHYLNRFLTEHYRLGAIDEVRLTFNQKAKLLPNSESSATFVKPGIVELNVIRNKFSHRLNAAIGNRDMNAINTVLRVARRGVRFSSTVDSIEAFTTVACTFLVVPQPKLGQVFVDAFSQVKVNAL